MLFPLVILLLGVLGIPFTGGSIVLLLLGSQWYILFNVIAGASAIPADLKEAAQAYGMTRLYIPCVFPYLVTGLITAAGGAWNATKRTAIMCAEAVFWRCHRRLVSDFLLANGVTVQHIMPSGELHTHTLTSGAKIENGEVIYPGADLFT